MAIFKLIKKGRNKYLIADTRPTHKGDYVTNIGFGTGYYSTSNKIKNAELYGKRAATYHKKRLEEKYK